MIKTFKWLYRLGYKHAESKYYRLLVNEINKRSEKLAFMEIEESTTKLDLQRAQEVRYRLEQIVRDVFRPEVEVTNQMVEIKNRFES